MTLSIVIAPLSNDPLRDWPMAHHRGLAKLCVERLDAVVQFIGTREQRAHVSRALNGLPAERYRNLCGTMDWARTGALVAAADGVVSNNSGIAHLAARLGVTTLCIFGASHNPFEWMPRGRAVSVLFKKTGCSPCAVGTLAGCPFDQRCLTEILPENAYAVLSRALAKRAPAIAA